MPAAVAACRVCLAMDVRLLTIAGSLQLVYERITKNALHTADGRPVAACYICYAQLNKCRKLIRTSLLAEKALNAILLKQSEITETSISLVDRKALGLCGSLGFCEAIRDDSDIPADVVIKTEIKAEIVKAEIGNGDSDDSVPASPLQPTADVCVMECSSDEDPSLSEPCDIEVATTEELGDDVAPAQKSEAGTRRPAEGSTTNRKLKSQQESTTLTAQGQHHTCDVCQRQFKYPSKLKAHYSTHTGDKPFQCDKCQKAYSTNRGLIQHLRTHTGEKPFQCNVCDHRFNQRPHLLDHLRTHTGEKPFQCNVCEHRFNTKSNLIKHFRTHTGEKPHQCNVCGQRFNRKHALSEHFRTHTGETPFQCDFCDHRFKRKSSLLQHFRTHTGEKPYQCNICDHRFHRKFTLIQHSRTHTGEKPFKCNVCDHRFNQRPHLLHHLRTHTGEKPFQCHVCPTAFTKKNRLIRHMRTHIGETP